MSPQHAHSSDTTSATQQLRAAREFTLRCSDAPRLSRKEERRALVAARSAHRRGSDYEAVEAEYQRAIRVYGDDSYFKEFAKDCYSAGVSLIQPRRTRRRAQAIHENQPRREWREEILEYARRLDEIDREGGFDSADEFLLASLRSPEGDTHYHRAWEEILETDRYRLAHIVSLRPQRARHWLGRVAARFALACLWVLLVVVIALELDDRALQITMLFPVLALPEWMRRRARTNDRFMERVLDIQCEHRMARRTLWKHMGRHPRVDPQAREFTREPRECQLTELLGGMLSR